MEKHPVLYRQLKRCNLTESTCPQTIEQWQQFLDRINRAYNDLDQERYLSERLQQISSREMEEMFDVLQKAESIARLGSWTFSLKTNNLSFSTEGRSILGLDTSSVTYKQVLALIHRDDRSKFNELVQMALQKGQNFETEIKCNIAGTTRWIQINGKVIYEPQSKQIQTLHGIIIDITEKKAAQKREQELNSQLMATARRAGMADVATSVLHNIGNILNSVNVSITLLKEKLQKSKLLDDISQINNVLQQHADDFANFLTKNPQGQHLPEYLRQLEKVLKEDQANTMKEVASLVNNIQHIKDIVAMQQSLGGGISIVEETSIPEQLDEAIAIVGFDSSYAIERQYDLKEIILLDKIKLTQILVNLIRNAKDSIRESKKQEKKLTLLAKKKSKNTLQIQVMDNGVGILSENITKIFSFGFTTKKTGHGFGLHTSALLAKEMDGAIHAASLGNNQGATFTLELPYKLSLRKEKP